MDLNLLWMVLRLLLAAILGGLIGVEREAHGRPAGLRTHILVSVGSALFTIVSMNLGSSTSDPTRIAAQIVSGIGFLGAGTIIRQGSVVRGLTTAASLWTTAAIGMAAGSGGQLVYLAVVASIIVFLILSYIHRMERALISQQETRDLYVTLVGGRESVSALLEVFNRRGVVVRGIRREESEPGTHSIRVSLRLPTGMETSIISEDIASVPVVDCFDWD